jgi:spore coat protein H
MVKKTEHNVIKLCFVAAAYLLLFVSCTNIVDSPTQDEMEIPVYKIEMSNEQYGSFISTEFSSLAVPAKLKYGNKEYNVMFKHHGYSSRGRFKKNYSVEYDANDPILGCKKIILSGQSTDPSSLRYYLAAEMFKAAGLQTTAIKPVFLYVNNTSLGLYYVIESINEEFFKNRDINVSELYKAVNGLAKFSFKDNKEVKDGFEKCIPEDENYSNLEELISVVDNEPYNSFPEKFESMFDVDKYLKYMAVSVLICNWDGIVHNFELYKNGSTGRYEIVPWDLDFTFRDEGYRIQFPGISDLLDRLLQYPQYKDRYKKYFYNYLNGAFSVENVSTKINEMKSVISKAYSEDRWIQENGYDLDVEAQKIIDFVKQRHQYIIEHIQNY